MKENYLAEIREHAKEIFYHALKAVDPYEAVKRFLNKRGSKLLIDGSTYDLDHFARIYVVGAGKAGATMAQAVEELLGGRIYSGQVNVKYGYTVALQKILLHEAAHPVPDQSGVDGTKKILTMLQEAGDHDLVICLISGGGSALLICPADGISLEDMQTLTALLLRCGATIHEINTIRKHCSAIKGGGLAKIAYPARLVTLLLSDVIGDDLDVIASGPTVPDASTFYDAREIISKYGLIEKIPATVRKHLEEGIQGRISETPKANDTIFKNTRQVIIGSNILALKAARKKAEALGYHAILVSSFVEGETKEIAKVHTAMAKEIHSSGNPVAVPACIISGGETTVTLKGKGQGGRNQEFVLAGAIEIQNLINTVILSGGTDGTDGPTDAAGALADNETVKRAESKGLHLERYLANNDAYHFFQKLHDLLITGPTNTNVMDIRLVLVGRPG